MSRFALVLLCAALTLAACGDDGSDSDASASVAGAGHGSTSTTLDFGGLALEVPDGFYAVPVPADGFGLAVPDGFQATLLTDEAVEVLRAANVPDTGFVSAALKAAEAGSLFYAAGLSPDGAVADVKLDVQAADDPDALVAQVSSEVAARPDLEDVEVETDTDAGVVRIRFTTPGPEGSTTRAQGTQFLFRGPDAVWSMIITSEDEAGHDLVADGIGATFVLGD